MSKNRENVAWQSEDGTWSLGHYTVIPGNVFDEDYDDEWDVDYDFSTFWWVTVGHRTEDAAQAMWRGTNPGGGTVVTHGPDTAAQCAEFDRMAKRVNDTSRLRARQLSRL